MNSSVANTLLSTGNTITSCQKIETGLWVTEFALTDDQQWLRPELKSNRLFAQKSGKEKGYEKYANRVLDFHVVLHEFYKWY